MYMTFLSLPTYDAMPPKNYERFYFYVALIPAIFLSTDLGRPVFEKRKTNWRLFNLDLAILVIALIFYIFDIRNPLIRGNANAVYVFVLLASIVSVSSFFIRRTELSD